MLISPLQPTNLFKFLSVLDKSTWGSIFLSFLVCSFILWLLNHLSPYSYQNNFELMKDEDEKRYFDLGECFWYCMTSLTPIGGGESPKCFSALIVAGIWWMFGFCVINLYMANLSAVLTADRLEVPMESLDDLSKQFGIDYTPLKDSGAEGYFYRMHYIEEKLSNFWSNFHLYSSLIDEERDKFAIWDYAITDKMTKIYHQMQNKGMPKTMEEAIARVRASPGVKQGYAFLGDATDIRYLILTSCDLQACTWSQWAN